MIICAIDPGTTQSALVVWQTGDPIDGPPGILARGIYPNDEMLVLLREEVRIRSHVVIEMIASYGMAVGAEVFETCVWIGRFMEACSAAHAVTRLLRREIKLHLCADSRAKDANIRQALIDRFGGKEKAIGRKHSPGPLYGIKGDEWSALAVAITYAETHR